MPTCSSIRRSPTRRCSIMSIAVFMLASSLPAVKISSSSPHDQLVEIFAPYDPEMAHEHLMPAAAAELLGRWKPAFIHDQRSKDLVGAVIREVGFSPADTHYDLPKPRTAVPVDHLTTGIAFAFPWHRDTWYAAPRQQINWWLPIYDVRPNNTFMFDLEHFQARSEHLGRLRLLPDQQGSTLHGETGRSRGNPGRRRRLTTSRATTIIGRPGSVLLFSGSPAASIPNTSGRHGTASTSELSIGATSPTRRHPAGRCQLHRHGAARLCQRRHRRIVRRVAGAGASTASPPEGSLLVFAPPS